MMPGRRLVSLALAAVAVGVWLFVMQDAQPTAPRSAPATPPAAAIGHASTRGFRSEALLDSHFQKHGAEFGSHSAADYLRRAQALRDAELGDTIEELRRADGVITRYDRADTAFIAFDRDGTIRTFFQPADGERYFRRQAARQGGSP